MTLEARPRRSSRLRRSDLALFAALAALVAAVGIVVHRTVDVAEPAERGFRLDERRQDGLTPEEFASLEHPVPEGTVENWTTGDEPSAALEDVAWWGDPAFRDGQGAVFDPRAAWRPQNPYRHPDLASPLINIEDGGRRTWTPPPCDCPTATVWMYGGSTTFGLNQRDHHTIASYLAKVAFEDGIRLEVSNRGQMGQLHWMEAERFRLDLLADEPPDLVLFYDGVNDAWASQLLSEWGTGPGLRIPLNPTLVDLWDHVSEEGSTPPAPPNGALRGFPAAVPPTAAEQAQTVVARWDRSRRMSQAAADRHGVVARFSWQPSRYSRDLVPQEPHGNAREENLARFVDQRMRDALPDDVIDVVDVFDGLTEPLFTDDVHHNETGARTVGEALYAALRRDLLALAEAPQP